MRGELPRSEVCPFRRGNRAGSRSAPSREIPTEIRLGALEGGQLELDLAHPGEVGLALLFGQRAFGGTKFRM